MTQQSEGAIRLYRTIKYDNPVTDYFRIVVKIMNI